MTRANPLQAAFNAGELGPRMSGRVDFAKYRSAGARVENLTPLPQGGLTRRPGTRFVAAAADAHKRPRLIPFEFSTEQAYVLEACDGCLRFFRNKGQIVVQPTDAAISNGSFDSDLTDWADISTGGASISPGQLEFTEVNTLKYSTVGAPGWGISASPSRPCVGVRFTVAENSEILDLSITNASLNGGTIAMNFKAGIYTDVAGAVGVQVGTDSPVVTFPNAIATRTASFAVPPVVSAGQTYWAVLTSVTAGRIGLAFCSGRPEVAGGWGATPEAISVGSGGFPGSQDVRIRVRMSTISTNGTLNLNGNGSDVAAAEQAVTTSHTGQEHVLKFRILGVAGDKATLRVGNTAGGDQVLADTELEVGYHAIAFTPGASPFYVGFRNEANKTVRIDDVAFLGNGAGGPLPLELGAPYGEADLTALKWAQSADVMYFAHSDYPPHKLERRGNASWSLVRVAFEDGPYQDQNTTVAKTLQPSATSGNGISITAEGHAPFLPGDVGRSIRLAPSGEPGWAVITEYTGPEQVKADVKRAFAAATATPNWRLGAWSAERGFPSVVTFFEQRLVWASTRAQPQSFWMSQSSDLENMRPDSFEGGAVEVQDDDGLDFTIAADEVNAIRWLSPGRQLILGTSGGEWSVAADGPVVTPTDIAVKRESTNGSANIQPLRIGSIVLFVQRAKRKLRELVFSLETDGFRTPDLTILADHITESGLREIVYQQEPDSQVHCVREDGVLATLTYRREQDVAGWSRHLLGGRFGSRTPVVESMATIPGRAAAGSENRDEAWIAVKRTIDGATFRSIEVFEASFEGPNPESFDDAAGFDSEVLARQKDAFYVDCGLTYDGPLTQMLSGLDHLEGETVAILADGALHPDRIVAGGAISLQVPAGKIHVGLPYRHVFTSLKLEAGAAAGTAVGKVKRVHGIALVLLHSLGLRIGPSLSHLEDVPLREVGDAMDTAVPLFTGERFVSFDGDFERDARIVISGDAPLPFTLLAAAPELKTNELI